MLLTVAIIYIKFKKNYLYWKSLNIPYLEPTFPIGSIGEAMRTEQHFGTIMHEKYEQLKKHGDYCGLFFLGDPTLFVLSPEFAKTVLLKDFQYFTDRGCYYNEKDDPLSANLFFVEGDRWKSLRAKLTPIFSSGKLKQLFYTIFDYGKNLQDHLKDSAARNADIDIEETFTCYMINIIASLSFGVETDCLENSDSDFKFHGKKMMNFGPSKALLLFLCSFFPKQANALGIRFNDKDTSDFIMRVVKETIDYRKQNNGSRNDFLQLLINMMENENSEEESLTFNEVAAQAFIFFFGGFESELKILNFKCTF